MWQATLLQRNQGDFLLLVVWGQIGNWTLGPSFGHNLGFKYPQWVMKAHFRHLGSKSFPMVSGTFQSSEI
jgi:hypothetical protein